MAGQVVKPSTIAALVALTLLSACKQDPTPQPSIILDTQGAASEEAADVLPSSDASEGSREAIADLDWGALEERQDPERLLRFYTNAIRIADWTAAARAWSLDAQMTPDKLKAEFGGEAGRKIAVGKGDTGTAAGSIYYEAPVTIGAPDAGESRRGSIVLRRANDVPGASALQLVWRIERSSIIAR